MNKTELNKILENHKLWLNDGPSGRRADLEFANLSGATFNKETVFPKGLDPIARGMKLIEEKAPEAPSPTENKVEVAAGTAATAPKTLHEELSVVLEKHGLILGKTVTISINLLG